MKNREGFTLIEIMMAVSLIAILLSAIAGICFPLKKSIHQARENQVVQEQLREVWKRFDQDLSFAFIPNGIKQPFFEGKSHEMTFYCLDSIRFAGELFLPGARKVIYQYQTGSTALEWSEKPLVAEGKKNSFYVLNQRFQKLQFHYLNQQGVWQLQWQEKEWPKAVRVSGLFVSKRGSEIVFEKTFYPKST